MSPVAGQHHAPPGGHPRPTVTMMVVMDDNAFLRRLDGVDLYLWLRVVLLTALLAVAALLGVALT